MSSILRMLCQVFSNKDLFIKRFLQFEFLPQTLTDTGYSQSYTGTILRVIDGSTYVFQTTEGLLTVRMYGTDAPERDQPFAKESAEFLKQYLNNDATFKSN